MLNIYTVLDKKAVQTMFKCQRAKYVVIMKRAIKICVSPDEIILNDSCMFIKMVFIYFLIKHSFLF